MKPHEIKQTFSKLTFKKYLDLIKKGKYIAHKKTGQLIIAKLKNKKAEILDLGCGTGMSSILFFKKKYLVTGIDITPNMIKQAKKLPFTKLICQDIEKELKVPKNHFDAVIMTGVMETVRNPLLIFKQVNKVLKKKGYFAFTLPKKISKEKETRVKIRTYTKKEIEPLFKKTGFICDKKVEFHGWYTKYNDKIEYTGYLLRKK